MAMGIRWNKSADELLRARQLQPSQAAQSYIDSSVLRCCDPYVPKDTGQLIRSGIRGTKIGSGKVIYQDNDLSKYNDNQLSVLRRRRFGFVFQSYNLVRELTAQENILLPVMLDSRKPDENHLNRLIEILGIGDRLSHLPGAMSGGQQQRVCIARALANKPAILFADEPTGNLDGKTGREVLTLMRTVSQELGITMILVTHDLGVAEQAERIIRLEDGQVADDSGVTVE